MPALLPPRVVAPLSECSAHVRVQNQLTGATVEVLANGAPVGGGVATWSDQTFPLTTSLHGGQHVTARQTLGPDVSPDTPPNEAVAVQARPTIVGLVGFSSPLYACADCLHLDGLTPGAKVEVRVGAVVAASGVADDGTARLQLTTPVPFGSAITAQQTACGVAGAVTTSPVPDLPGGKREGTIPAPTVSSPLLECQRSVSVSGAYEGATVTVTRSGGPPLVSCFDYTGEHFDGIAPLVAGETLRAAQSFPHCQLSSAPSPPVKVGRADPVPAPTVRGPLCDGTTTVRVEGLLAGCPVQLLQNGTVIGLGEAPGATVDFEVAPPGVRGGTMITAEQELCGRWSAPSAGVTVDPKPATLMPAHVPGPLFECASIVRVTGARPGSNVVVYSQALGQIGWQHVFATWADIPVAPQLHNGDSIYAVDVGCGLVSAKSNVVGVQAAPKLSPPTVLGPIDDFARSVTVANVTPGARVDVAVNGVWRGGADAGGPTVEVAIWGPLAVGDAVAARQRLCTMITRYGEPVHVVGDAGFGYLTQHFEPARTGWNRYETVLSVAAVQSAAMRQLFTLPVDGQLYAQPLYVHHVYTPGIGAPGVGAHNVVYVATEADSVYAYDADAAGAPLWQRSLLQPGETVVPSADVGNCTNVAPSIGITSTPVIDWGSYTMYVVGKKKRVSGGPSYHYALHALDIATGKDRPGSPREITATYPGSGQPNDGHGHVSFPAEWQMNRPGLLLLDGVVYVAFASHCDFHAEEYHGWVLGYDMITLAPTASFCTSPDSSLSGIWQGGIGLAADAEGFIYCTTGNGPLTANSGGRDYGDCVLKLTKTLTVSSHFTPADQPELLADDIDLGSGGVLILPDGKGFGNHPNLLVTCGKDGNITVLDRMNLGGYTGPAAPGTFGANPNAVQTLLMRPGSKPADQTGVWGGPAYFDGGHLGTFVYYCGNGGALTAYALQSGALSRAMVGGQPNQTLDPFPSEGGTTPVVSSNAQVSGTAVVWAVGRRSSAGRVTLRAFDATNLRTKLFDHDVGPWANADGGAFIEPTVIQGRVYVGCDSHVAVFGA